MIIEVRRYIWPCGGTVDTQDFGLDSPRLKSCARNGRAGSTPATATGVFMKCITKGCTNCSERPPMGNDHLKGPVEGRTICVEPDDDGWICEPCWTFLIKSTGRLNQIYANAKEVLRQRESDQAHYYAGQAAADVPQPRFRPRPSVVEVHDEAINPEHNLSPVVAFR